MKPFVLALLCTLMGLAAASPASALTLEPDTGAPEGEAPGQEAEKAPQLKDKDEPGPDRTVMYQQGGAPGPRGAGDKAPSPPAAPPAAGTEAKAPKKPVRGIIGIMRETVLKGMEDGKKVETHAIEEKEPTEGAEKKKEEEAKAEEFIEAKGQKTLLGSTTDENGNTVTASKTDNGVWITEVTDRDGNPVSTQQKIDLPGGGHRAETVNHQTGRVTRTEVNGDGSSVSSETDPRSNTTTTTQRGVGGKFDSRETRDNTTGKTLSQEWVGSDGRPYIAGDQKDSDEAFKTGKPFAFSRTESDKDWTQGTESSTTVRSPLGALDQQLISQMQKRGEQVKGSDLIVSSQHASHASFRRSSSRGEQESEQLQWDYEINQVDPGAYEVEPFGNPVEAEQYGTTPSAALTNAIESASGQFRTHVHSEFTDYTRSTRSTDSSDEESEESVQEKLKTSSSFVPLKDYVVESVGQTEDGQYVVKIKARAGVIQKR